MLWALAGCISTILLLAWLIYNLWQEKIRVEEENDLLQKEKEAIISDKKAIQDEYRKNIEILKQTAIQKNTGAVSASELLDKLERM